MEIVSNLWTQMQYGYALFLSAGLDRHWTNMHTCKKNLYLEISLDQ